MISTDISNTETVRNVYIIDPEGIVRLILIYPMNIGRCIPEILRALEALQMAKKSKGATPANWTPGGPIINPSPNTFKQLKERAEFVKNNRNGINWYLSFKNQDECNQKHIIDSEAKKLEDKESKL